VGVQHIVMVDPVILSLVLPYVRNERQWVLLAACTNKSLSFYLDVVQHHWESRYKKLIADLQSGRARFDIERYVHCGATDPFTWNGSCELGISFSVSVVEPSQHSFARQVVPQVKQARSIMNKWNAEADACATYTAKKSKQKKLNDTLLRACKATYFIGSIPLRIGSGPLLNGDIDALAGRLQLSCVSDGYSTDESWEWECECGEQYRSNSH